MLFIDYAFWRGKERPEGCRDGLTLDPAGMLEAAKGFRRLKAHKQLPMLKAALEKHPGLFSSLIFDGGFGIPAGGNV